MNLKRFTCGFVRCVIHYCEPTKVVVLYLLNFNICGHVQFLQDVGLYESQEEAVSREEVLGRLDQVEIYFYGII